MLAIGFYPQAENQPVSAQADKKADSIPLAGYVSLTGKLVLPIETVQAMSGLGSTQPLQVGSQAGKRTLSVLYLVPTDERHVEGFPVVITPRGVTIELGQILTDGRINYKAEKYSFTLTPYAD